MAKRGRGAGKVKPVQSVGMTEEYRPYGAAFELLHCQSPEVLISGPAGSGKSRACLLKLHLCAEQKPGFRGLILRKTRESLTETGLVTFESKILPQGHPAARGAQRRLRQSYHYPNGSEIVVAGLDKPEKVMSSEYDLGYIMEAIEVSEAAWEAVTTRLRNNVLSFQQLIADTNPDKPTHWLKKRCDSGKTKLLESKHQDNPSLWDRIRNDWTPAGALYMEKLRALTGPRKLRLCDGRWVQAEGVVYDGWDTNVHLIDWKWPDPTWPRYWGIDFGYTHAFVCLFFAEDPDGRLYLYREIHRTHRLVEEHAKDILSMARALHGGRTLWRPGHSDVRPSAIICDHDAEGRATLEKHLGIATIPAKKSVQAGIQAVAARLKIAGDGKPRLFVMRDSLYQKDQLLEDAKLPCNFVEEVDGYIWDERGGRKRGEEPLKANDDACDVVRYVCAHRETSRGGPPRAAPATHSVASFVPGGVKNIVPQLSKGRVWMPR